MLSERAKGKRRASEPSLPTEAIDPSRELTIRFTEGEPDLILRLAEKETVRDVKGNIRLRRPHLQRRRLRLIHSGRLLTDGTFMYSWLATLEERQTRAVADESDATGVSSEITAASSTVTWLHCSVGPVLEDGEVDGDAPPPTQQLQPLRGFDRLTAAGFSEEDIASIRRQFHRQTSTSYLDSALANEEDYDEHARALEEQWIDSMDGPGTASLSDSPATSSSVLQGVVLGFFFPLLPLFFFSEIKPAVFWDNGSEHEAQGSVIFSRRMQMGIVLGFNLNLLFGVWRYVLGTTL